MGIFSGIEVKIFKTVLEYSLELLWKTVPQSLDSAGWTPDSAVSLCNYTWIVNGTLGFILGVCLPMLDTAEAKGLGPWILKLHKSSTGSARPGPWLGTFVLLGLLTVLSGASVGPEPVVIIVPSVLAGAVASGPLQQPPYIVRTVALAGGAGGLAAFFNLSIAAALFVLEVPSLDGA